MSLVPGPERQVALFDTTAMSCLAHAGGRATEAALPVSHALLRSPAAPQSGWLPDQKPGRLRGGQLPAVPPFSTRRLRLR